MLFLALSITALSPPIAPIGRRALLGAAAVTGLQRLAPVRGASAAGVDLIYDISGLRWADLRPGDGSLPRDGETVTIDYMMTRQAGAKIYSTKDSGERFSWVLGDGSVIEGLEMGVLGRGGIPPMKAGGVRRLVIPQPLGYGMGRGLFDDGSGRGIKALLPVPPKDFQWRNQNNEIVDAYLRFMDTYMNEMRLDQPGLVLDVILYAKEPAATAVPAVAPPTAAAAP